jgi:hypothetical protein
MLLWQEYVEVHPHGRTWRYTQFCGHYKAFAQTLKRSMRQHWRAGEKLFIDFAGTTLPLREGARAQVFVSAMASSSSPNCTASSPTTATRKKSAAMVLEWICRRDPRFDKELRDYLFTEKPLAHD